MTTLIEVLNKIAPPEFERNKEVNTIAFRGSFIGVLSYSRENNSRKWMNFYRRNEDKWITNEIFMANQAEVVNESPLSFKLKTTGGCSMHEGSPDYIKAEKKLRRFGLY